MIELRVECANEDKRSKVKKVFHDCLVGSPGYINDDIILGDDPNNFDVILLIGNKAKEMCSLDVLKGTLFNNCPEVIS